MVSTRSGRSKVTPNPPKAAKEEKYKEKSKKKSDKKAKQNAKNKKAEPAKAPEKKIEKKAVKKEVKKEEKKEATKKVVTKREPVVKKPAGSSYKGYTPDQYAKYKINAEKLSESTIAELKELCRKNGQKVTGTKPELIERIADGQVLGAIPKCTSCGGGRPKWDPKSATYTCPGYMEDADFINCHKKFSMSEIQRTTWQD